MKGEVINTRRFLSVIVAIMVGISMLFVIIQPQTAFALSKKDANAMYKEACKTPTETDYVIVFKRSAKTLRVFKWNGSKYIVSKTYPAIAGKKAVAKRTFTKNEYILLYIPGGKSYHAFNRVNLVWKGKGIHSALYDNAKGFEQHKYLYNKKGYQYKKTPFKYHWSCGCIRTTYAGSEWICDHIKPGTGVSYMK